MVASNSCWARSITVPASCWLSSASTLRASSTASPAARLVGTARTARVLGEKGVISSPRRCSTAAALSAVATSCGVAAKVAGISSGWLVMRASSSWFFSRS